MPHLVILYTRQLDTETDMGALCRKLADTMLAVRDDEGRAVFPLGGTRVLAYPAAHHAVADGSGDHAFCWFHLRMARGPQRGRAPAHWARCWWTPRGSTSRRCWPAGHWA
jgi:5-carboxymethyl-2-hydroxymuconate isomerase